MQTNWLFVPGWEVAGIKSPKKFFDSLAEHLLLPAYFCLEGTSIAQDVQEMLESNAVPSGMWTPTGTIWPTPRKFHILATNRVVSELILLAARHAAPEICDHFHAYNDKNGLLQWYDAFFDPLLIDNSFNEEWIKGFCQSLNTQYERWHGAH